MTSTPKQIGSFSGDPPTVSPDGEWVAVPLASGATLYRRSSPEQGRNLSVNGDYNSPGLHQSWWSTPMFSADSKTVLITGMAQSGHEPILADWLPQRYNPFPGNPGGSVVQVWDTGSGRHLLTVNKCYDAQFSPKGNVLATLRDDGTSIELWHIPFRASLWLIVGRSAIIWLFVAAICWVGVVAVKMVFAPNGRLLFLMKPRNSSD